MKSFDRHLYVINILAHKLPDAEVRYEESGDNHVTLYLDANINVLSIAFQELLTALKIFVDRADLTYGLIYGDPCLRLTVAWSLESK